MTESPATIAALTRVRAGQHGEPPGDWRHSAACHDVDPELFFPIGTSVAAVRQQQLAQTVCAACPVHRECLRWALDSGQEFGIWGGLSEDERRSLKRRTARARGRLAPTGRGR